MQLPNYICRSIIELKRKVKKISLIFGLSALLLLSSCGETPILEIPESTEPTENSLVLVSNILSTFDIVDDLASTDRMVGIEQEVLLPSSAKIILIDSVFIDGDGLEVILDFGSYKKTAPHGTLCLDQVYRAGKLKLELNLPYTAPGSVLSITAAEENPFFSGNGVEMVSFSGKLEIDKSDLEEIVIRTDRFHGTIDSIGYTADVDLRAVRTHDAGDGIQNDEMEFTGGIEVNSLNQSLRLEVFEPLVKKYSSTCANHILSGIVDLYSDQSISEISVDFDPNDDQACDNLVEITYNGKTINYTY